MSALSQTQQASRTPAASPGLRGLGFPRGGQGKREEEAAGLGVGDRPEVSTGGYKTKQIDKARVCKLASS